MATPEQPRSPSAKLKYVALLLMGVGLVLGYFAISQAGDRDADRSSALVAFAVGLVVGGAGAGWMMRKEAGRTDEGLREGSGGAMSTTAAIVLVGLFMPYIFFGDKLPEVLDQAIAGVICGTLFAGAVGLIALGRAWQRRGF